MAKLRTDIDKIETTQDEHQTKKSQLFTQLKQVRRACLVALFLFWALMAPLYAAGAQAGAEEERPATCS
jgi:hypothetical protein